MSLPDLHVRLRREFIAHPGSPLALGFLLQLKLMLRPVCADSWRML
jgi:hypothetical protein